MKAADEIFKKRDELVSVTELCNFSNCQAYSFFGNILGRRPYKGTADILAVEADTDYHRLYSKAVEVERVYISDTLFIDKMVKSGLVDRAFVEYVVGPSGIEPHIDRMIGVGLIDKSFVDEMLGLNPIHRSFGDTGKEFFKYYVFGSQMEPKVGLVEKKVKGNKRAEAEAWLRFEHFADKKAGIEAERIRSIIKESENPKKALKEFYVEAKLIDFDKEMPMADGLGLFGVPDLYRKVNGKWVPEEFKVSKGLDDVSLQLDAYVLLTDRDNDFGRCGSATLVTLEHGVTEYSPSQRSLKNVEETLELLLELKEDMVERRCAVPLYPFESCNAGGEDCKFGARCDPIRVESVENLGEWRIGTGPKNRYEWVGQRKTVGIEALVGLKAIKEGNTAYETARMFGGFQSLHDFCHEQGIDDLDEELRFSEMNANSFTLDRLVLAMEYGFKDTQRMSMGGVAKLLNISDTSAKLMANIAYKLGWMHEPQEIPHPFAEGKSITYYRRKKRGEMDKGAEKLFDQTRRDVMMTLRKCKVPLTTFCKSVFKEMEKLADIDEEWQYIWDSDFDAEKTGGGRRFRSSRRVEEKKDVLDYSRSLVDKIETTYTESAVGAFFSRVLN